jgi:hypothetical protein
MGVYSELVHYTTRHISFVNDGLAKIQCLNPKTLSDPLGLRSSKKRHAADRKRDALVVHEAESVAKKIPVAPQEVRQVAEGKVSLSLFVHQLARVLEKLKVENSEPHLHEACFLNSSPCSLSLEGFIERVITGTNKFVEERFDLESTGACCAVLAIEYLRRSKFRLCELTMHRCFLTAYLLAFKFLDDVGAKNTWWAYVIGCNLEDVNKMEACFCNKLQWKLSAGENDYRAILSEVLCA